MDTKNYYVGDNFDEMFTKEGQVRPHYADFLKLLGKTSAKRMSHLQHSANKTQVAMGMTFNVYHDNQGIEKILHLDIVPRIIPNAEWKKLEAGLKQRIYALNLFIQDANFAKLTSMHFYAWKKGLKTGMYYLRTLPKADAIQFTVDQTALKKSAPVKQEEEVCESCSA